jgi:hypothetical protein
MGLLGARSDCLVPGSIDRRQFEARDDIAGGSARLKPFLGNLEGGLPLFGQPFEGANDGIYNFWDLSIDESGQLLSEDYHFCKLWRNLGGKIYLAPYVRVTHAGTYWFR